MNKSRLETFSDGVFAIAITLLVFTITTPSNFGNLGHELEVRWPSFVAYTVSFAIIGIMWLNHHSIFSHFDHADRGLVFYNMFLLLTIAFLPYPTGVLGDALRSGHDAKVAAVFYSVTTAVNAYAWTALWLYASVGRRLLAPSFPESQRKVATLLFSAGTLAYTLAVGVAFLSPLAALFLQGAFAVYYAADPISRRAALARPHGESEGVASAAD